MASSAAPRARKNRIRPVSRETRFIRLRGLKCFETVHQRLLDGWAVSQVADYIQKDCGEYKDIGRASLETILSDYRASLPAAEVVKKLPHYFAKTVQKVEESLDELAEMEALYRKQLERIDIDLKTEKTIGKLLPSMTQEMRAAREILSDIAQLKMDLGLNQRNLGKVEVEATVVADVAQRYDVKVVKAMESPDSRRKLLGIAERFLALADGRGGSLEAEAETVDAEVMSMGDDDEDEMDADNEMDESDEESTEDAAP